MKKNKSVLLVFVFVCLSQITLSQAMANDIDLDAMLNEVKATTTARDSLVASVPDSVRYPETVDRLKYDTFDVMSKVEKEVVPGAHLKLGKSTYVLPKSGTALFDEVFMAVLNRSVLEMDAARGKDVSASIARLDGQLKQLMTKLPKAPKVAVRPRLKGAGKAAIVGGVVATGLATVGASSAVEAKTDKDLETLPVDVGQ